MKFTGKTALVTGGGRGIGAEIARSLAKEGATVAVSARTESEVKAIADEINAAGGRAQYFIADLALTAEAQALVPQVEATFGAIDFLINNAGIASSAPVVKQGLDEWNRIFAVNLTATFLCTQAALPKMIERGSGRIVNIASVAGLLGNDARIQKSLAYNTSKGAVVNLTRALAAEWGQFNITVNAIAPGFFPSKMTRGILNQIGDIAIAQTPLARLGGEEDLKGLAALFASDASAHITGQIVAVDGGAGII